MKPWQVYRSTAAWRQRPAHAKAAPDTSNGIDWTKGAGRAKWNTWRELRAHLIKFMNPAMADRVTSVWYHDATGVWSGSDLNRVRHGKPPRGKRIGPG